MGNCLRGVRSELKRSIKQPSSLLILGGTIQITECQSDKYYWAFLIYFAASLNVIEQQ